MRERPAAKGSPQPAADFAGQPARPQPKTCVAITPGADGNACGWHIRRAPAASESQSTCNSFRPYREMDKPIRGFRRVDRMCGLNWQAGPSRVLKRVTADTGAGAHPSCPVTGRCPCEPAGLRILRTGPPDSGRDQQAGLVVNGGTGGRQAGLADPEVVTAQQQVDWVRAARSGRHGHRDYRPRRTAACPRVNSQRYGQLQLSYELIARGSRPVMPPCLHALEPRTRRERASRAIVPAPYGHGSRAGAVHPRLPSCPGINSLPYDRPASVKT